MPPKTIAQALCRVKDEEKMNDFLDEILTEAEKKSIYTRWELMLRLKKGETHRKISSDLSISLCKITRGNKILKNQKSVTNSLFAKKRLRQKGKIVVFSAASGAGKSTILSQVCERMPHLVRSVSATTRPVRGEEKDGVDYFFMSREDFIEKRDAGGFVEWAEVHGNFYGTPRDFIESNLAEGKIVVMDIDVQGKVLLQKQYPRDVLGIFIEAPSYRELEDRLFKRGTDSVETIRLRMKNAKKERDFARTKGKYDYFIVNKELDKAVNSVCKVLAEL